MTAALRFFALVCLAVLVSAQLDRDDELTTTEDGTTTTAAVTEPPATETEPPATETPATGTPGTEPAETDNPTTSTTAWPWTTTSSPRPTTSTETPYTRPTNIPAVPPQCCKESNGAYLLIPDPTDCRRFYACNGGLEWLFNCPADLFFSYVQQRCEWPAQSGCIQPTTPSYFRK